jgi:hypothetical protein
MEKEENWGMFFNSLQFENDLKSQNPLNWPLDKFLVPLENS